MRYFFESKVEKEDDGYSINIPFNIWEVCKQRDVIEANIVIDNSIIDCELWPKEKGLYVIKVPGENSTLAGVKQGVPHKILMQIHKSLIKMDQNSPYSFDNPIRKIDSMEVIMQEDDGLCGQCCVAMLAGVTLAEVITVMDCREWQATMGRMISALNYYGIDHSDIIVYTEGRDVVLPKCAILMEKMGRFCHYLVYYDGKYYDPNLDIMTSYDTSKLLGYLEIKCD